MKNENDILMMNNNINGLGYTGDGSRDSKGKKFFIKNTSKFSWRYSKQNHLMKI